MGSVTSAQGQYLTYTLKDPAAESEVEIVPERGGIATQWRIRGEDIFYLDTERFTHPELTVRGGIPILFPICGPIPNNTFNHNGQSYELKRHGFARDLPWQVVNQSSEGDPSLTIQLSSSDQTLGSYPFTFQVQFRYKLQGTTLTLEQTYTNQSSDPMPFSSGLHPYFSVKDKSQLQFDIPSSEYLNHLTESMESFTGSFNFDQPEVDVAFKQLSAPSASVSDLGAQRKLTVGYDTHYSTLVFWTQQGKEFYCIEPWTAPRGSLVTGEKLLTVDPDSSLSTTVSFTISDL